MPRYRRHRTRTPSDRRRGSYFKRSYERADLQVTITGLDPEASAAAIDAGLGRT